MTLASQILKVDDKTDSIKQTNVYPNSQRLKWKQKRKSTQPTNQGVLEAPTAGGGTATGG
jgi:hypothetical protein